MLDHLPILTCFYTLPNDDAIPQTELPSYIFIQNYQYTALDTHQVFLFLCSSKQITKMLVKFQSISKHESWTENLEAVL